MSPTNLAAVLPTSQGAITVGPVDYPTLQASEVLIRNSVVAFNPVEYKIARSGYFPIQYPAVLGFSYGGVVEAVDEAVTRVKKGDFVYTQNPKGGGYQRFSASHEKGVGKVDEKHVDAAAAVVLNLRTIIGAAVEAGLDRPKDPVTSNAPNGKKALVYGGSSSLGAISIQYLQQAGYTVISTSSPRNNALVGGFGATIVDHTQPAEAVIAELKQHGPYDFAFDAISTPAATAINAAVLGAQSGDIVLYSVGPPPPADVAIPNNVRRVNKSWPGHLAATDATYDEWVFTKYIPEAVAAGKLRSVPTAVVKGGLGAVDEALRRLEKGVSGQKLILYPWEDADKSEL